MKVAMAGMVSGWCPCGGTTVRHFRRELWLLFKGDPVGFNWSLPLIAPTSQPEDRRSFFHNKTTTPPMSAASPPPSEALILPLVFAAPMLVAFNTPPSTALVNQLLAAVGWSAVCTLKGATPMHALRLRPAAALLCALAVLVAAVLLSWSQHLPAGLALQTLGSLGMAACLFVLASQSAPTAGSSLDARVLTDGVLVAALISTVLAGMQTFAPDWVDGTFIARSDIPGRAVANLRQPNHLASLLLWGLAAWVPVSHTGRWFGRHLHWRVATALGGLLILALVLSTSRTGALGVLALAFWGWIDRRLVGKVKTCLLVAPLVYLACWGLMMLWSHLTGHPFGGQAHISNGGTEMLATTRYELWKNALALIQAHPWQGVGFGMFNMAWTLTPFAERSGELFDHVHNLPLHLAVELGMPAAVLVMALLFFALWQAARRAWRLAGDEGVAARTVFVMLPLIGLHSLLEYPLWYNYFLFPTAWAWGLSLRQPPSVTTLPPEQSRPRRGVVALGLAMLAGSLWLQWDYRSLATLYQPHDATLTQPKRIALGQTSLVFSHFADYMAAITAEPPSQAIALFKTAAPVLLDPPLMETWAKALNETGKADQARYLAERLHEFHDPYSERFFAPCKATTHVPKPFQCEPAQQAHTWKEFLR